MSIINISCCLWGGTGLGDCYECEDKIIGDKLNCKFKFVKNIGFSQKSLFRGYQFK